MSQQQITAPYTVLLARGHGARSGEVLNAGIVLHAPQGAFVSVVASAQRLRALHPDFTALHLDGWAQSLEAKLREHAMTLPAPEQQHALLQLLALPFWPSEHMGMASISGTPEQTLRELMAWLVDPPSRTLKAAPKPQRRRTKLVNEIRTWLRGAKVYSSKADDLTRGKVVSNYPIDPGADLYADFAVLNGKLNAIETLDLRGVERLTPALRGDAALKSITLDEARGKIDGRRLVVLSATDYSVARPAIQLVSRYADEVYDMHEAKERQRLSDFIAGALHRREFPGLKLSA